jgi:hypothetical protein
MHPETATALASRHRHDLTAEAASQRRAAASRRGPRRAAPHAHLPAALVPRYRVSWSRTTFSPAPDARHRGRSWIIVISATRSL